MILSIAEKSFNITMLPKDRQDEGLELLNVLEGNLDECKMELKSDHLLYRYKTCVRAKLDSFDGDVWDLREDIIRDRQDDEDFDVSCGCELKNIVGWSVGGFLIFRIVKFLKMF